MLDLTQIFDGTPPNTGVAVTATRQSTNVLDLLTARDVGAGEFLGIHVLVTQQFATLTSLTVTFEVCATAGGSYLSILSSPVIPVAQLIVGAPIFRYALPVNQVLNATAGVLNAPGRFIALRYTVGGSNATTGAVFSYLAPRMDRQETYTYPSNYTVATTVGEL